MGEPTRRSDPRTIDRTTVAIALIFAVSMLLICGMATYLIAEFIPG